MSLTFEPLLPPMGWVSLTALALVMWLWYASSRPKSCSKPLWALIVLLLASGMAAVLTVLLNPVWLERLPPPPGKPLLTILLDESSSMKTDDGLGDASAKGQSRFATATDAIAKLAKSVEGKFDVRVRTFAENSRPVDVEALQSTSPAGLTTDLATPLLDALVSDRPQGQAIMMISDGIHNASATVNQAIKAAGTAKARNAPVYTSIVGTDRQVDDIEVRVPRSQELSFVGQTIPVTVEIQQVGQVTDRINVTLIDPDGNETSEEVRITANATTELSFLVTPPKTGLFQYQVKANSLPSEATGSNNNTTFQVRVVDEPVRALVLEGKPYWDTKFLLRMLTSDPSLEVDCIVKVTSSRYLKRQLMLVDSQETTQPVDTESGGGETSSPSGEAGPTESTSKLRFSRKEQTEFVESIEAILEDKEKLDSYQILLLGREAETYLSDLAVDNIRNWVSRSGGALVCYRGAPVAQPGRQLNRLLPVRWESGRQSSTNESRFRVQVTERGNNLNWLRIGGRDGLTKLPALAPSATTESIKPLAIVLGRSNSDTSASPALTYQPYGTGKVVVVEGSGMWRWAFLAPEYQALEQTYGTLWQSLLRWLISSGGLLPGEDVALQMDQVVFTENESVSAVVLRRAEIENQPLPEVRLLDDQGRLVQTVQPIPVGEEIGVYEVFLGALPVGHYQATLTTTEAEQQVDKTIHFDVQPDLREQLEVSAKPAVLRRIADESGGKALALNNIEKVATLFNGYLEQSRPEQFQRTLAWDRWWVLLVVFAIWTTTWAIRRRNGLV